MRDTKNREKEMTKTELNKHRNILHAKHAELLQVIRNRDGIVIEK